MTQAPPVQQNGTGTIFTPDQLTYVDELKKGRFDLQWLKDPKPNWGIRAEMRKRDRGLTLQDINNAYAGTPEDKPALRTMAPRGSVVDDDVPDMGYTYNEKYQVWADNVVALYEEATARQWSATRDIPWDELKPLPDDLERAQCQIATLLTEVEMIASDFPAKWVWQMNQHFHEVKMFLCTQAMDEARHLEVFRKRALANGGGLMRCLTGTEVFLKTILHAPTYVQGSFLMHVLGEGLILDIFRSGEFLAKNKTAAGVKTTASGLQYQVITEGKGPKPAGIAAISFPPTCPCRREPSPCCRRWCAPESRRPSCGSRCPTCRR